MKENYTQVFEQMYLASSNLSRNIAQRNNSRVAFTPNGAALSKMIRFA